MARKMGRNLKRAAAGLMACAAIALCAVSPAWAEDRASDVVNVTVPTRIECALGADGTVTAPSGLEVVNLGPQDLYVGASTVDDFGQKVEFAMDLDGSPLLSRAGGKDVEGEVEFAGSSRKALALFVSKLNRTSHAALMDAAAQGEAPMFTVGFRFTFKALQGTMAISGEAKLGKTLTATVSGAQADAKLAYRWYRDGHLIAGAETASYTTNEADQGKKLKCEAYDAAGRYVGGVSAEVGPVKGPEAFAVFSADDGSLNFYKRVDVPKAGEQFEGRTATEVYTGFENRAFWSEPGHEGGGGWEQDAIVNTPWFSMAKDIIKVTVIDRGIAPKKLQGWFQGLVSCKHFDLEKLDTSKSTSLSRTFTQCRSAQTILCSSWNTENIETMHDAFYSCISLKNIDLSKWNTNRVTTFHGLFAYCESIEIIDLSNWNTAALADMSAMFKYCTELKTIDLSNASTENLMTMSEAFCDCRKLQQIKIGDRFNWLDATGYLPTPSSFDIPGADGKWYALSDKKGYAPADIPSNKADTYVACPEMLPKEAFAVFSADDGSLNFYKRSIVPTVGSQFEGRAVTSVYTNFEDKAFDQEWTGTNTCVPWADVCTKVTNATFVDTIQPKNMAWWFHAMGKLTSVDFTKLDASQCVSFKRMFSGDSKITDFIGMNNLDTSSLKNVEATFDGCVSITDNAMCENWNVSNITNWGAMFFNTKALKEFDASKWVVEKEPVFRPQVSLTLFGGTAGYSPLVQSAVSSSAVNKLGKYIFFDTKKSNIPGADGYWYDAATSDAYKPEEIPSNKAATYVAVNPLKAPTVTIEGQPVFGSTLTAKVSGQPAGTTATSYQWQWSIDGKNWRDSQYESAKTESITLVMNGEFSPENNYYRCVVTTTAGKKRVPQGISEAVGPVPPDNREAFAVFSADDGSLNFYKRTEVPKAGSQFEGKIATRVFTGMETLDVYDYRDIPWFGVMQEIKSVSVVDSFSPMKTVFWFYEAKNLLRADLSRLDASRMDAMDAMFFRCHSLETVDLGTWSASSVNSLIDMFMSCTSLKTVDVSHLDTRNVTHMNSMFGDCSSLVEVDVSNFDMSNVVKDTNMLYKLRSLKKLTLGAKCSLSPKSGLSAPSSSAIPNADGKWYAASDGRGYAPTDIPSNKADTYYASKSLLPVVADESPDVVMPGVESDMDVANTEADSAVEVDAIDSEAVVPGEVESEEVERKRDEGVGAGTDGDGRQDASEPEMAAAAGTPPEEEGSVPVTSDEAQ